MKGRCIIYKFYIYKPQQFDAADMWRIEEILSHLASYRKLWSRP